MTYKKEYPFDFKSFLNQSNLTHLIQADSDLLEESEIKRTYLQRALIEGELSGSSHYSLENLIAEIEQESINK